MDTWDMLRREGARCEVAMVDAARVAEPREVGRWPDCGVWEPRLDQEPVFAAVWLWSGRDVDVVSRARLRW